MTVAAGDVPPWTGHGQRESATTTLGDVWVGECSVGKGVFAGRHFSRGERILVFRGTKYDRSDPIHATRRGANLLQTGRQTYILPDGPGLFVNHSCDPNAGISNRRRLIAIRDIRPHDEIRFDYSTTMDEDRWTMRCRCGEPKCRRVIEDFKHLPPDVRLRYVELGIVPGFILRRRVFKMS